MRRYVCEIITYDPFCGQKEEYRDLGDTALEAWENWKAIKHYDYDYGEASSYRDSYRHTLPMWAVEKPNKVRNDHNFYTPVEDRIHVIPVYGWDGSVIDHIKTTVNECIRNIPDLKANGWEYDMVKDCIRTMEYRFGGAEIFDNVNMFEDDDFEF